MTNLTTKMISTIKRNREQTKCTMRNSMWIKTNMRTKKRTSKISMKKRKLMIKMVHSLVASLTETHMEERARPTYTT